MSYQFLNGYVRVMPMVPAGSGAHLEMGGAAFGTQILSANLDAPQARELARALNDESAAAPAERSVSVLVGTVWVRYTVADVLLLRAFHMVMWKGQCFESMADANELSAFFARVEGR